MIIRQITFHHLLTYYGDQSVDLPATGDTSLTVIVGPNNSGKTSVIRGLKFWFYGSQGVSKKSDLPLVLNNKAKAETPIGKTLEAWVEITFERETSLGKEKKCLRRTVEAKRTGENAWDIQSVTLTEVAARARIQHDLNDERQWQFRLEGMMPRALFDAFYFKGEPLDGKLLGDVTSIRDALGQFLHEDQWKEAEAAAAAIRDKLAKELATLSAGNRELTTQLKELERLVANLSAQRKALESEQQTVANLKAEEEAETENLSKLGDEKAAQEVKTALNRASQRETDAKSRLDEIDDELLREIGASSGLPFLLGAIPAVAAHLAEMERDNILPADISEGFIDRVLERPACICGKKHDSESRSAWEAYRQKTLAADVNDGLRKLLDWVKPEGTLSVSKRSERATKLLRQRLADRSKAVITANEAKAQKINAQDNLAKLPHEEIARIGKALQRLRGEIRTAESRVSTIEKSVSASEYAEKNVKAKIDELKRKSGVDPSKFERLQKAQEKAANLHRVLGLCRNRLSAYFHRVLQSSVTHAYDSKATDGSQARVDKISLLPSIHVAGQRTGHLGGGQSQLLALAYVVALARLRQDMHTQMETLGVRLGKIDDLSFFMDSPLGNMEEHYKRAAVELIPGSARQVVTLLWKEDWVFARPILEPLAKAIHAVKFHTTTENLAKIEPSERIYPLPGGDRELLVALPEGEDSPRSELHKIL